MEQVDTEEAGGMAHYLESVGCSEEADALRLLAAERDALRERIDLIAREQDRLAREAREIGRDEGNPDAWEDVAERHEQFAAMIREIVETGGLA